MGMVKSVEYGVRIGLVMNFLPYLNAALHFNYAVSSPKEVPKRPSIALVRANFQRPESTYRDPLNMALIRPTSNSSMSTYR